MKALGIIAAAIVGAFTVPTAANAYVQQPVAPASPAAIELASTTSLIQRWDDRRWDGRRYDRRRYYGGRRYYDRRNYNRRYYRGRYYNRGRHYGWRNNRWNNRVNCYTRWRYGRPVRICGRY